MYGPLMGKPNKESNGDVKFDLGPKVKLNFTIREGAYLSKAYLVLQFQVVTVLATNGIPCMKNPTGVSKVRSIQVSKIKVRSYTSQRSRSGLTSK